MPGRPIILVVGPTAGGKTALSIALAQRLPGGGEIVGADSMQVYRGMDIGTAKPTAAERAAAPHHVIDVAEPDEPFTVEDWRRLAEAAIENIRIRGKWPIVVGGTNLYIKVLLHGMFEGPEADPALRARLAGEPTAALHARLRAVDPEAAARIHPNDRKRLTRALEVYESTGRPISEWQREWDERPREDVRLIGLDWPPEAINPRINARVRAMVEEGLVDEIKSLIEAGRLGPQARAALGYKQFVEYLEGRIDLKEALERTKIETRRFARQQRTWLKRFRALPNSLWLPADRFSMQELTEQALAFCLERASA